MSFVSKLPEESRQRYEAIAAGWRAEFEPEGYQEERLVDILIQNDWLLQQSEQRLLEAEAALCNGSGDEQEMEAKQRRKSAAERSFYRAWNALQGLRKELMRNEVMLAKMEHKLFRSEQENTRLRAENDLLRKGQESQEPQAKARAEYVYRRFHFLNSVPISQSAAGLHLPHRAAKPQPNAESQASR